MSCRNIKFVTSILLFFAMASSVVAQQKYVAANVKPAIPSKLSPVMEVHDAYQADLQAANSRYRVCVSDVISIKFPHAPEFN